MKRGRWVVLLFTLLFGVAAVIVGKSELANRNYPFSVLITENENTHEIGCFEREKDYFVFLPAYAEQASITIQANPVYDIFIEDQLLTDGMSCEQFPLNKKLNLFYRTAGGDPDGTVTFLQSRDVAAIYIDVPSGSMDYIHEKKGNEEGGYIQVYDTDGKLWHKGYLESIRGRGNYTWGAQKKPYSITTMNPADLLGMGEAREWILLANTLDATHLRNKTAYDLAAEIGLSYSPQSRWADLYLNGEYAGLYLLTERNEIHPQRVDIGSGNFLVSMELEFRLEEQNYPYIRTDRGTVLRIHQTDLNAQAIRQIWESAENAIFSEDGIDPVTGKSWTELIDLDSWAKKYLIEELLGNYDAASISQYFYYDQASGKIFAGPVWDMDNSQGYSEYANYPNSILAAREHLWSDDDYPFYHTLLSKEIFLDRVMELYRTVFQPALQQVCETKLDMYAMQVSDAAAMNAVRWMSIYSGTGAEEIGTYLEVRQEFVETYLENREQFITVSVCIPGLVRYCWAILPGETLPFAGADQYILYHSETGESFDPGTPIYQNTVLLANPIAETEGETQ